MAASPSDTESYLRVRVKICGITRLEDGVAAAALGADAIGLVFYPPSPRVVSAEHANRIVATLPAFVTVTALFLDPAPMQVEAVLKSVPVDLLQFHGDEPAEFCRSFGRGYVKALPMGGGADARDYARRYPDARALLLDTHALGSPGGTGVAFEWSLVPGTFERPVVLAGGLDANNVAAALRQVDPYGVDVSSGVETAPGIKDPHKMEVFIREVNRVQ
jgi:phosphoribosylanthranilate isomerase